MRKIIFDTETTGFKPGSICQLAYIIDSEGALSGSNYFFKVDYVEPGAERVHGFSAGLLAEMSGGRIFGDDAGQIVGDFSSCPLWVAHNFAFDNSFLSAEFKRIGLVLKAEDYFCTMRRFTPVVRLAPAWPGSNENRLKFPTLAELVDYMKISNRAIKKLARDVFNAGNSEINSHDARYDCSATYLCYKKGAE
jgi:DNA polymerase-3 subunit epsilon